MTLRQKKKIVARRTRFNENLLKWSSENFRTYPWREDQSGPYHVLIAEILLKRTTATAALRVYQLFLDRFPNFEALSLATEDQLTQVLAPIGLNRQRASSVVGMTRWICDQCSGVIPDSLEELLKIPGLGPYSARAILSFGFGIRTSIVDGNVARIINRFFHKTFKAEQTWLECRDIAELLLPEINHKKFNYALIDLGGTVCRPSSPKCDRCPLSSECEYVAIPGKSSASRTQTVLRSTRISHGLSLVGLAKLAGLSKQTIMNAESARTRPTHRTLLALGTALGVPHENLVTEQPIKR